MCATVLFSFLKINAGRKRGVRQKDLAGLSTPTKQKSWQAPINHRIGLMVNLTRKKIIFFQLLSLTYEASDLPAVYKAKNFCKNENWGTRMTPEGGDLWKNKHNEIFLVRHCLWRRILWWKAYDIYIFLCRGFPANWTKTPLTEPFRLSYKLLGKQPVKKIASLRTYMPCLQKSRKLANKHCLLLKIRVLRDVIPPEKLP